MNTNDFEHEKKFKDAFQMYLDVYMSERNIMALKEMLSDDFCGYGTGLDEAFYDYKGGFNIFARDIYSAPNPLNYKIRSHDIKLLDSKNAIVVCELDFETIVLNQKLKIYHLRMMMVLHEDVGNVKISGLHVSLPTKEHAGDESFPLKELEDRNELLNRMVQEQTKELFENQQQLDLFFTQSLYGFFFMMLDEPLAWSIATEDEKATLLKYAMTHQRMTKVNQAMLDQYGAKEEDFIGLTPADLFTHDPEYGQHILRQLYDLGHQHVESRERRLDGTPIIIDGDYTCLYDEQGRIIGCFGVQHDITDRKQVEQEREKLQSQLIQAQKMESVGILAGGVAHDFNNLLHAMRGHIELLLQGKSEDHSDARRLLNVTKSMDRAAQLVQQLLLFSRKIEAHRVRVDVNQEVADVVRMLERTIPKMISFELHLDPAVWPILGDPVQIEQALLNLASNAVDAMPEGGRLTIETANVEVDEDFVRAHPGSASGRHLLLVVSDTGCGMDMETLEHIFDPFFTTKEVGRGTGLGLASVYGIVKAHGGHIQCYSEPGAGSTFRIYLPAVEQGGGLMDGDAQETTLPGGSETILVVDDEPEIRDLTQEALEMLGYSVKMAVNGEQALDIYREHGKFIDLVLLDLNMPGMGGHKCLQELLRLDPTVRVLIASGYSASGQARDTLESGAAGFIGKPYQLRELEAAVRRVLDEKEAGAVPE